MEQNVSMMEPAPVAATAPEKQEATPEAMALAKDWIQVIDRAKAHWSKRFEKMKGWQQFARGKQWPSPPADGEDDRYVANLTKRQINLRVAAIYAKNPKFVARRRPTLDFAIWDGEQESAASALELMANFAMASAPVPGAPVEAPPVGMIAAAPVIPPEVAAAQSLLQDIEQGQARKKLYDRMGKTLEIVFTNQLSAPIPNFKTRFKQAVRRCKTTGVAYVKLGYQRALDHKPEIIERINDDSRKIAAMEDLAKQVAEGEIFDGAAELEVLRAGLEQLQATDKIVVQEGLAFAFPKSTKIIVDIECTSLRNFIGAGWVAEQHDLSVEKVRQRFGIDLKANGCAFTQYKRDGSKGADDKGTFARIYEVYDLDNMQCLWVCEGYDGPLKGPGEPDVYTEQFHPYFTLVLNDIDDDDDPYPDSDVHDLKPMQMEHNRSREALRDHRVANRPGWMGAKGILSETDKDKLGTHAVNEFIELENFLATDDIDIKKKIQAKPTQPIDESMYDTAPAFQDILRVSGDQEANLGGTAGATATESTIAENSRTSGLASETDEVDEFLSWLARACGQLLLTEMQEMTVKKIAGVGAVWPDVSRQEVADELYLEVVAGSSGRPNRALRVNAIERTGPLLLQVPGIKPKKLAQEMVQNIDETADVDDWIDEKLPSIVGMNQMQQPQTSDPATAPNQQGAKGGDNKQRQAPESAGPTQRTFPAPVAA